jgi:hypothetical protein
MNIKHKSFLPAMAFVVLLGLQVAANSAYAQGAGPAGQGAPGRPPGGPGGPGAGGPGGPGGQRRGPALPPIPIKGDTSHNLTRHFVVNPTSKKTPDAKGFIQRWLVLEPVKKNLRSNSTVTETYLRTAFAAENFSPDFNAVPKSGEAVKIGDQELKWHALDSKAFNFNLYNFSYATDKTRAGVLFWLVTVINCPEDINNVRLAAGVNSAGAFWINGKETLLMPGDKDIIVDNMTSPFLTLKKGKNILRTAIINGQGMCNFCVRFVDEKGMPVKNYTLSFQ